VPTVLHPAVVAEERQTGQLPRLAVALLVVFALRFLDSANNGISLTA
jgi:hypothetical protein